MATAWREDGVGSMSATEGGVRALRGAKGSDLLLSGTDEHAVISLAASHYDVP